MTTNNAVTASAAANIAFVKYWGAKDLERVVPMNGTISMTLDRCRSQCSLEFVDGSSEPDEILLVNGDGELEPARASFRSRIQEHLDRVRKSSGRRGRFRMATSNSFPAAAGIASSASGFATLSVALAAVLELELTPAALSDLARRSGSGSATRSVFGGYVEWPVPGADEVTGWHAEQLADHSWWDLRDVIAIVQTTPKRVSSLEGHRRALTSPYYQTRQTLLAERLAQTRSAIEQRDLEALGSVVEEEAIDLHLIAMSSRPAIFYWLPATLTVLAEVRALREEGVGAWATMDAGANVHVLCSPQDEPTIVARLEELQEVERVIRDRVGPDPVCRPGAELLALARAEAEVG